MTNKVLYTAIIFFILCINAFNVYGQFRFGGSLGLTLSQVDGDNLRGFHNTGISVGLLGGYKLNSGNSLVVDVGFNTFGSNKGSENIPSDNHRILLETKFQTINILAGYQFLFGDRWDGKKYYLMRGGINFHKFIEKSNNIITNSFGITEIAVPEEDINSQYFAINLSVGKILSDKFVVRFGVDYGLSNLLKSSQYNISSISPYQIYFNTSYYVF